uniref:RING-type domain-containing protein n=1 Tax=Amphimedon queenslandica TaxID=400682 RepID=A0A1X7T5V2_AMPQE
MARFLKEDLLFVEELKVPAQIEIECPVCLHILTDPHQVSCCGRTLCKSCIERARASNGSCPMCKEGMEERFRYSVDKDCLHFVNFSLQVYCTNKPKGCEWKGNLRDLSTHLSKGKREGDCLFEEVKCRYECQTKDQRQKLVIHEKDDCNERPYKCEHCALEDRYIFITGDHLNTCPKYPTTCRNNCAQKIPRESISDHLTQCPLERVDCVFSWAGCNDKPLRKDVDKHTADTKHMTLLAVACGQLKKENEQIKEEMKKENEKIKKKMMKEIEKIQEKTTKEIKKAKEEMKEKNEKIEKKVTKENEEKERINARLLSCLGVINCDAIPALPIRIYGRAQHFYTEVGGHHMSAACLKSGKIGLAFHEGKFDGLSCALGHPKIFWQDYLYLPGLGKHVEYSYRKLGHDVLDQAPLHSQSSALEIVGEWVQ